MITVTHRRYVPYAHAHYAGNLVDGAYSLGLFGDVATEVCIRLDGDEGLFASYDDVQFKAPVQAGDVLEVTATVVRMGTRSRTIAFAATVVVPGDRRVGGGVLDEPIVAVTADRARSSCPPKAVTTAVCVDVGSTYTKAALIDLDGARLVRRAEVPDHRGHRRADRSRSGGRGGRRRPTHAVRVLVRRRWPAAGGGRLRGAGHRGGRAPGRAVRRGPGRARRGGPAGRRGRSPRCAPPGRM